MSDFTDSLRGRYPDDELLSFVLEMFDRVDSSHDSASTELEQFYHQGEKDAVRRILAFMTSSDVDTVSRGSIVAYKLRGDIPTDNGEFLGKGRKHD